jgi:hypothetical protein
MVSDRYSDPGIQKTFAEQRCTGMPAGGSDASCFHLLASDFFHELSVRYGFLPNDLCAARDCGSFAKMEFVLLSAVNARINEQSRNEADAIDLKYRAMLDAAIARFKAKLDDIDAPPRSDSKMQLGSAQHCAVGAGLQAYGNALQNNAPPPQPAIQPIPATQATPSCSSDFECAGGKCAKDSGAFQGVCLPVTNAYGLDRPAWVVRTVTRL